MPVRLLLSTNNNPVIKSLVAADRTRVGVDSCKVEVDFADSWGQPAKHHADAILRRNH